MISSGLAAKSLKDLTNVQEARAVSAASLRGVKRRAERPRWTGRRAGGGAGRKRASRGWPRAGMRAADDVGERRGRASAANAARRGRGKGRRRTNRIGDYGGGQRFPRRRHAASRIEKRRPAWSLYAPPWESRRA
ncbi:hypothetical protein DO71_5589 [Burkholderia pseudomallei]|nr:hypothetical protein DO71_5589 [Burkholderia pseudomallei]